MNLRASIVVAGLGLAAAAVVGIGWVTRGRQPAAPAPVGATSCAVRDAAASTIPAPPTDAVDAGFDALDAQPGTPARDLLSIVAGWVDPLERCPLAAVRAPDVLGFARLEVTSDLGLAAARLVDVASGAELADDCFRETVGAVATAHPDGSVVTVWWPVVRPAERAGEADAGPSPIQVPGVDMFVVPYGYPIEDLPRRGVSGNWLGLCGPHVERATPRDVTLSRAPNEENSDFVDLDVDGCGPKPRDSIALRGPALGGIGARPARVRAVADSPMNDTKIQFGAQEYRLWQQRSGRPYGVLALQVGATVQVLATDEDRGWIYQLVWAGDLDRDGALDLIVRDNEPDMGRYRLFLSRAQRVVPVLLAVQLQMPGD